MAYHSGQWRRSVRHRLKACQFFPKDVRGHGARDIDLLALGDGKFPKEQRRIV